MPFFGIFKLKILLKIRCTIVYWIFDPQTYASIVILNDIIFEVSGDKPNFKKYLHFVVLFNRTYKLLIRFELYKDFSRNSKSDYMK